MTVYIVEYCDYDYTHVHAVCSSRDTATEEVDKMLLKGVPDNYMITECELDVPLPNNIFLD